MTHALIHTADLIDNPSPRCPCVLVLDTSSSMDGASITQLNQGLQSFIQALHSDEVAAYSVDLAVISAGLSVQTVLPFTTAISLDGCAPLQANGATPLGSAVEQALNMLEQRKNQYRQNGVAYYQPWLVMISDGAPTDSWQAAAARAHAMSSQKKLVSLMVGVDGADMQVLGQFSNRPALPLQGLKFAEFFQWLSASMSRVSASASTSSSVPLPTTDGWASI